MAASHTLETVPVKIGWTCRGEAVILPEKVSQLLVTLNDPRANAIPSTPLMPLLLTGV